MFPRVLIGTLLGVLLILGAFAWRQHQALVALQQDMQALSGLRRANAQLAVENGTLREKMDADDHDRSGRKSQDRFAGPLGNLRLATEAKTRGIIGSGTYFSPYTPFASVARPFANAFCLTPEDISVLKGHLASAERKIDTLAAARATASRDSDGSFVIALSSTPEGRAVRDELMNAFRATLGEERYRYFEQLAADQLARCLGHFGAQERTITIKRNPMAPGQYLVEEQGKAISRQAGGFGRTTMVSDRPKLEAQLGGLAKLLPPDF